MRFHVLACDYDGTLALHGRVDAPTIAALQRVRDSGRQLILVTGRQLSELLSILPEADLFERIVAENGALLYRPDTGAEKLLADGPSTEFVHTLRQRGVDPAIGHVIVATWRPKETVVFQTIRDLGLDWQVILNKDAVMALPSGVNKGTGLASALRELDYSPHEVIAVGDAENDHALFSLCECGVAVANAVPALKERADWVTEGDHGAGVQELIDACLADELRFLSGQLGRHCVLLGHAADGAEATLPGFSAKALITGPDHESLELIGKTLIHDLDRHRYQYCLLDSRGAYEHVKNVVALHGSTGPALGAEVMKALSGADQNVVVDLHACAAGVLPSMLATLLEQLQQLRVCKGRPHWLILDDAANMIDGESVMERIGAMGCSVAALTPHPHYWPRRVLQQLDTRIIAATDVREWMQEIGVLAGEDVPAGDVTLQAGEVLLWRSAHRTAFRVRVAAAGS